MKSTIIKGVTLHNKRVAFTLVISILLIITFCTSPSTGEEIQIQKISEHKYANGSLVNLKVQSPESDIPMRNVFIWTPPVDAALVDNLPVVYFLHLLCRRLHF